MTQLINFIDMQYPELITKLWEQVYMVGLSTIVAIIIGIPLGVIAHRNKGMARFILSITNILQTIPSLALLAVLLPFLGIGMVPAITALILYALLPIVRNTLTGLESVSPDLVEAARGIGFTPMQQLMKIELPLAIPSIVAGIRISAVIGVGIATLAAFIGAGGLGDFINRGLMTNNTQLIMLGAIPAALLALFIDFSMGLLLKHITKRKSRKEKKHKIWLHVTLGSTALIALISIMLFTGTGFHKTKTVVVGSKNFTESVILAEMISKMIETHTQLSVERRFDLGSTKLCQEAMVKGSIDIYPDYTGTAYLLVLNKQYNKTQNSQEIFTIVKNEYLKNFNIVWLDPFGFDNSQALVIKKSFAEQYHLNNISDLKSIENQLIIAIPSEAMQRSDGIPGLKRIYQLYFSDIKEMSIGLMYQALIHNKVNVVSTFSTDGQIPAYDLMVLKDDKHLYLPYDAATLIRGDTLKKYPEIKEALSPLLGHLTNKTMQTLNAKVQIDNLSPEVVADIYLREQGYV